MKNIFLITLLINCFVCNSQNLDDRKIDINKNTIEFKACNLNPFVLNSGSLGIEYKGAEDINSFFKKKLNASLAKDFNGVVLIQALIDTTGKICCKTISSPSGLNILRIDLLGIENIIGTMDKWIPAKMDGKKWNSSVLISLNFKGDGEFKVLFEEAILKTQKNK